MTYVVKVVGLVANASNGRHSPWDGQYLWGYHVGTGPMGSGWLQTTANKNLARQYADQPSALADLATPDPIFPWRWDGKPNCANTLLNTQLESYP
jgi:hypothetical protein